MKCKYLTVGVIILFISVSFVPSIGSTEITFDTVSISSGNTLYVGGSGPNNYTKIQDAIDNASYGDTVFVYDDSSPYYENVHINKFNVTLEGENRYTTVIDGMGIRKKDTIRISADRVTVFNFTITNCGSSPFDAGIHVLDVDNITIKWNVIIDNSGEGGILVGLLGPYLVRGGSIQVDLLGLFPVVRSSNNTICNNMIAYNSAYGIMLVGTYHSEIYNNIMRNAKSSSMWCQYSNYNNITGNYIYNNTDRGIDFYNCSHNNISWNYIFNNGEQNVVQGDDGICIRVASHYNVVWGNFIGKHPDYGLLISYGCVYSLVVYNDFVDNNKSVRVGSNYWESYNNTFYHNNFINNTTYNARQGEKANPIWDDGYPSGGNYWDDYNGADEDGDGIGDTSYYIPVNGSDDYPLMEPWNILPYTPSNPNPYDSETNASINTKLRWKGGDRHPGDIVTYDVYFGTNSSPPKVVGNHSSTKYDPGQLNLITTYYWKIIAWDKYGVSAAGPLWHFTTGAVNNTPPYVPSDPEPEDGATNADVDVYLNWTGGDPDGDPLTYDVYFGTSITFHKVASNHSDPCYDPLGSLYLDFNTIYYWQIIAWDEHGDSTTGPKWSFTTRDNDPPNTPSDPDPEDGATDVDINNVDLSWNCNDPDGDTLYYDVYFEANDPTPDELVSNNQSETTYDPGTMNYSMHYYWKIVAWDEYGASTSGPVWDFTTMSEPNDPPYTPSDPDPENGSTNIDIDADLSWTCSDPDPEDTLVYDVYLEANDPTPDNQVADDISETWFDPGTLDYGTTYYWQIIAIDNHYAETEGPVWHFTTEVEPEPDLSCEGSLSWSGVKPGSTVDGSFSVKNIGDPNSLLDWEIESYPGWGNWIFNPESGEDLTPEDGEVTVNVSVVAPDEKNKEFTGNITIVNKENASDFCTIAVSLSTPKNKPYNFILNMFAWLFERFPNAFPILRHLLELWSSPQTLFFLF